jgi:hypothetical protein
MNYTGLLSAEQLEELDRRMEERENGIGRDYTLEEVRESLNNIVITRAL